MNAQLEKVSWDGALLPSSARHPFKLVMYSGGMRLHVLTSWANPPLTGAWLFADDRMFSRYHSCLCETLARLGFALHMAITNKPLTEVESPSSVHAELKTLVNRIIRDAVTLPNFKVIERKMSNEERLSEDIDIKTYEDILATAILNKFEKLLSTSYDVKGQNFKFDISEEFKLISCNGVLCPPKMSDTATIVLHPGFRCSTCSSFVSTDEATGPGVCFTPSCIVCIIFTDSIKGRSLASSDTITPGRESRTTLAIVELLATSSTLEAIKCGELGPVESSLPTTIFAMYLPQRLRLLDHITPPSPILIPLIIGRDVLNIVCQGRLEIGVSESGSVEDCDGISRGDGSWSESSHTEPISLTVEECIEEVTTYNSSEEEEAVGPEDHSGGSELDFYLSGLNFIQRHRVPFPELGMDIIDGAGYESNESGEDDEAEGKVSPKPTDLYTPIESWEENWLFQKRRLKSNSGANKSVPVPMLVPNPSEDYRALIGDRDAEEISDLSECSEGELDATLSELASPEDSTTFSFPDRGVMSGRETSDKTVKSDKSQQALSQSDTPEGGCGGSSEEYSSLQDGAPELAEATNNELFKASSVDCLSEFGQQDSEYTEDYAAVTQRQMSSLMLIDESEAKPISKPRRSLGVPPQLKVNGESSTENQKADHLESIDSQREIELATPPKPGTDQSDDCMLPQLGTIAEREHKKWESALPLQNNPYSSENISKRLQKRSQYGSRSSSEASIELPDFHNEPPLVKHPTSPLKVMCTGSELDRKRYGRDYYVNSKLPKDETKQNTKLAALEELLLSSGNPQQPKSSNTGARQVSGGSTLSLTSLEEEMLQRDIYHSSFRAHNASPNFMMNPLYEGGGNMDEERDQLQEHKHLLSIRRKRLRPESGYSSSLDSIAEPLILLRLTPPLEPQMVERSFESLSSLRRAASLKGKGTRSKSKSPLLGGSLRSRKQIREDVTSALW
uniref:Uncharacterized protein n=1 Tax=Timema cristinae TaxID=61476 RepID=A0A7R9D3D9_TIMCR|nr:unnamed protein product [Timema cristinae]